jgi:hypothetical protein
VTDQPKRKDQPREGQQERTYKRRQGGSVTLPKPKDGGKAKEKDHAG